MADQQKFDDTSSPAARRGVRPFAGPAGAAPVARPFLRPASPGARPTSAPFAPLPNVRPALGIVRGAPPSGSRAGQGTAPQPAPRPAEPAPSFGLTPSVAAPETATSVAPSTPASVHVAETIYASQPEPLRRSITSEMVAIDAFEAFEAAWGGRDVADSMDVSSPMSSPVNETSLAARHEGEYQWVEELSAAPESPAGEDALPLASNERVSEGELPAWMADSTDAEPIASPDLAWGDAPGIPSADEILASDAGPLATLGEDVAAPGASFAQADQSSPATASTALFDAVDVPVVLPHASTQAERQAWPEPLLAEYAPDMPVPRGNPWSASGAPGIAAHEATTDAAKAVIVRRDEAATVPAVPADTAQRIAATLDRLAERVRRGEIDVSSVAPQATDAAVLASVLAALLGRSDSR